MTDPTEVAEKVFREEYGRVFATLVRVFGDFDVAEEAIQDSFLIAIDRWPVSGVPKSLRLGLRQPPSARRLTATGEKKSE